MSAYDFAKAPEVRALPTHVYGISVPDDVWCIPKPTRPLIMQALLVTALVPGVLIYDGTGRIRYDDGAQRPLMKAEYGVDYQIDAFATAMRELGGHMIPFAYYDPTEALMLMKLKTPDEQATPSQGIHPHYARL